MEALSLDLSKASPEALAERSEELKAKANKLFVAGSWKEAEELYTEAIDCNPSNHILYSNRSNCHLRLEQYGYAMEDAKKTIELCPSYAKGYYRRGCAHVSLGKYKEALKDFAIVCKLAPKDKGALARYMDCKKAVRREAFEAAIECEQNKKASETIILDEIQVPESYDGLRLQSTEAEHLNEAWIRELMEYYREQKKLHIRFVYEILLKALDLFKKQPTLVDVPVPENGTVMVYGDVHGQYYDLLNALSLSGLPSATNVLVFNGDLVDRGSWSVEVIVLLLAIKVAFPEHMHIARGNHETRSMNKVYGFEGEVKHKYNEKCFELFLELFNTLPLAHLVQEKIFVCHGGLFSEDNVTLDDVRSINRFREPPDSGLMCELLWSDPQRGANSTGRAPSPRGVGVAFGADVTKNFLETNKLSYVIRSHEVRANGYEVEHDGKLITVFSAPNYCDQQGNMAAIIKIEADLKPQFITFKHVEHPPMKPMAYSNMRGFGM
mmetsp:Transcript_14997/g.58727  ORF Transcript_14997/g.58727 Transcript_14997/m.58727 type:complete len:494 (+) Transcript_14997:58-1539(+)|eukprot:CAMPEP_0114628202 /NCGR_PEP_ID=MMETSP0168-20121206/12693_1 /TAXON_ID=95228 ORGANISM="Vannella sp., Strain DIVA3 517/6/12" /NCGR_SAMPLE_ID=MMETSP0168 /ASSEMBLY_ACC=CAM_ASM_000044 /LENGTH=493 /DNA_ID=CAMNT_0001839565 /DNA_START=34 /DNA_END=1515 /DNA_ORIENTATION=-